MLLICLTSSGAAYDRIQIDTNRDPRFLPYRIVAINNLGENGKVRPLLRACDVVEPGIDQAHPGLMALTGNRAFVRGEATQVGFRTCIEPETIFSDNPIWLVLNDQMAFRGPTTDSGGMFLVGARNDSVFAGIVSPTLGRRTIFLSTGEDRTGDSVWSGSGRIIARHDFDGDGRVEVLIHTSAARDLGPRLLILVQPWPLQVEWTLPCATVVQPNAAFPVGDSLHPGLLVAGGAPGNDYADTNFSDLYCYLFSLTADGEVRSRSIIGLYTDWVNLLRSPDNGRLFITHTLSPRSDTVGLQDTGTRPYHLTEVDEQGRPLKSVELPGPCSNGWWADYTGDGQAELYLFYVNGHIDIFNSELVLLARSDPTNIVGRVGELRRWADLPEVQLLQTTGGTSVYSNRLRKLADLGEQGTWAGTVTTAGDGTLRTFFVTTNDRTMLMRPEAVGLIDLIAIIYVDYQPYILSILFGLVVGLVTVNHYRRRTRSNLKLIAAQKQELEETHAALQQAQAQIIAQEKYRQARDIAGGFAHEIRNALFPARASVTRLRSLSDDDAIVRGLRNVDQAVGRAIDITGLITTYTRAESEYNPEPVDLQQIVGQALKDNRMRIESENVTVHVDARPASEIRGNRAQLVLVIDNLIRNSLDALIEVDSPEIRIKVGATDREGEIRVEDNGPGVPDADRERIFDMFYSTKPRTGTGVGLALSRKIVSLYDGTLICESNDTGATFVLHLPFVVEGERS